MFSQDAVYQVWHCDQGGALRQAPRRRLSGEKNSVVSQKTEYEFYQVHFKEVNEADMAVEMLNGRMFGKKVGTFFILVVFS